MTERDQLVARLKIAEHQFRLACTVNLAVANEMQTLDVPVEWTFGNHRVSYQEFGLRRDQAELAAVQLEMTATFVVAATVRDAILAYFREPKNHSNLTIVAAYQISRMLRNAFSHSMVTPRWSIDDDCRSRIFSIDGVISLDTSHLHGQPVQWRDYGGPLSIFRFGRYVRESLLELPVDPNREKPPYPSVVCYQQGRLIARRIDESTTIHDEGNGFDFQGHGEEAVPPNSEK
ncbi:MAG TPA: hypothetical protein PKA55_19990 [Rhodoblastus sp.]|nr:hypothetical protein [Rhodoblastus sp.]